MLISFATIKKKSSECQYKVDGVGRGYLTKKEGKPILTNPLTMLFLKTISQK